MRSDDDAVHYYLEQAARVRIEAEKVTIKEFRDELFKIAAAFERLATRARS